MKLSAVSFSLFFSGVNGFVATKQNLFSIQGVTQNSAFLEPATATKLNAWSPFNKDASDDNIIAEVGSDDELVPGPLTIENGVAGAAWVALVTWAFLFAPGSLGAESDTQLVTTLATQPYPKPEGINELWFLIWNCFVPVPVTIAALAAPTGKGQRLPATPFLWGSAALGYFALGPYFATRTGRESITNDDLGWATKNIFENRIFGIVLTALTISLPFSSELLAPGLDYTATLNGYLDLASQSRFVAVASIDIVIMSTVSSFLVGSDSKLRGWEDKSLPLTAGCLLFPVIGPALYLATRPSLED